MSKITFFAPDTDAFVESIQEHIAEYEAATGDQVRLRIIGSDEYYANQIQGYLAEEDGADVFMSGPILLWEHINKGFVEPLDAYVQRGDEDFDLEDFIPNLLNANRWTGEFGAKLGQGPLLALPINCESYNIAYNKDVFEKLGLSVPKTWEEYFETAKKVVEGAPGIRGFAQRGTDSWHVMFTGFGTNFWTMGLTDFDEDGKCAIASPASVKFTEEFIARLKESGPEGWPTQRWYELAMDFCAGKYGLIVDSDHYVGYFENPKMSKMAGRIGYATPPVGPDGVAKPNMWTWCVVMNSRCKDKEAAWRFMKWVTSKEFLLRAAIQYGNMNPTRSSVWDDPRFLEFSKDWREYCLVSRQLAEKDGQVRVTPIPNYRLVAERWVRALLNAYENGETQKELELAAADIDGLVKNA